MTSYAGREAAEGLLDTASPQLHSLETADDEQYIPAIKHSNACRLLYISHFLSTWNSRVFEFGAFLFLAGIYPDTLLPASIYALSRAASAAIFSPWLGSYIDKADRLKAVRLSIVSQRLAVAISCVVLLLLAQHEVLRSSTFLSTIFLFVLSLFACMEKLGAVLNTISVERDWVVIIAAGHEERLGVLNSRMRRIDLFCKLIGPLVIAFVDGASPIIAITVTGTMTAVSVVLEYFSIAQVYNMVSDLREPKRMPLTRQRSSEAIWSRIKAALSDTQIYVQHSAFLPSFSLALLYLTVLSFAGQMITYLVAVGIPHGTIGILRAASAVFELSATWIAPELMKHIGPVRAGIWFLNWQMLCMVITLAFYWLEFDSRVVVIGVVGSVIASRVGLWGFDLSAQIIVQEEVQEQKRGTFSSQEFALQNLFEMLAFASTIVFPRPSQFKYPATISASAVGLAGVIYAMFVRSRRGHLIHLSKCLDRNGRHKDHHHWWHRHPNHEINDFGSTRNDDNEDSPGGGILDGSSAGQRLQ